MISVCMATYNGERFLREQIDSILCQLNPEDELIISDDGSTDGTLEIITSYQDSRIKLLHHKKKPEYEKIKYSRNFYYATDNFENALTAAQGDYIFLADQDDVWMENKVKVMCTLLDEFDCVMCNYDIINDKNETIEKSLLSKQTISKSYVLNIFNTPFLGCLLAFKKNILKRSLPFPPSLIAHDLWIGCIAAKRFHFVYENEVLVLHRKHTNNTSFVNQKSNNPIFIKIIYRLKLLLYLFFN